MTSPGLICSPWSPFNAAMASRSAVNTRADPVCRKMPSPSICFAAMDVLFTTEPSGARLPFGKQTVPVKPRWRAVAGFMMTLSGSTWSLSYRTSRTRFRLSDDSHQERLSLRDWPLTVGTSRCKRLRSRNFSITSGTPPARKNWTVV